MAPVNFIKVLSVNSEDPVHNAQNLLLKDNPNKKWKCKTPGEKQAVVILQLEKASVITGIDIGNEYSAFVEVLVTKSTWNEDDYKVLLVASSLMSFDESKNGMNTNSVKFFNSNQLSKPTVDESWDRIKIICTQPFNKHVQYGLSFIIVHSKSTEVSEDAKLPNLGKFTWKKADDDSSFSAGSLFSKKKLTGEPLIDDETVSVASSNKRSIKGPLVYDDSIEPSTSKVKLNNDSKTESNTSSTASKTKNNASNSRRTLMYEDDDDEEPTRSKNRKKQNEDSKNQNIKNSPGKANNDSSSTRLENNSEDAKENTAQNKRCDDNLSKASSEKHKDSERSAIERNRSSNNDPSSMPSSSVPSKKRKVEKKIKDFYELLGDVVFVISGFENPYRGELRSKALEMGAKYKTDWNSSCTHLICAFPNTPKFQQVQGKGKIVKKEWIEECYSKRKRFPWRRFALDKKEKKKPESEDEIFTDLNDIPKSDCDTDEEINRIQKKRKKKVVNPFDEDTDIDEEVEKPQRTRRDTSVTGNLPLPYLPDFFSGKSFYISSSINSAVTKAYLQRCIIAYKGKIATDLALKMHYFVVDNDYQPFAPSIDLIKENHPDVIFVKQDWIRECSVVGSLVSSDKYVCD